MKTKFYLLIIVFILNLAFLKTKAQTTLPDSVFVTETFGTGNSKAALPAGRTAYSYNGTTSLNDGDYMIYKRTNGRPEWHDAADHSGNASGRAMVINAGMSAAEFYRDTIQGLTANTVYNVTLYMMNTNTLGTCGAAALLPKLQFIVEYYNSVTASYQTLTSFNSGFIPQSATATWVKVGGNFINPVGNTTIRYRIINNSTGGCGNDLAIDDIQFARGITSAGSLPVTGMLLSAQTNDNTVSLQWQTLTEINTSHFIAEKSIDAVNWNMVDSVKAAGYSSFQKNYSSNDYKAGFLNYYRIKQVDKDGRYTYSNIVRVNVNSASAKVYPNPFVSQVQLDVIATAAQKTVVTVTDMQGRTLLNKSWHLTKGSNSYVITEVKQLPAGMYFIEVKGQEGTPVYKAPIMKN